jgi:hypothetical protein
MLYPDAKSRGESKRGFRVVATGQAINNLPWHHDAGKCKTLVA